MVKHPDVIEKFKREIDKANEGLAQYETVKKFTLIPNLWTVESGELTPTLKVKRKVITQNYRDVIEGMY